jgi:predicted nuclease of predicted toxin-antitoxin system
LKLKIDENLPAECAAILTGGNSQADTVADEGFTGADDAVLAAVSRSEGRSLVTLDLDFANISGVPAGRISWNPTGFDFERDNGILLEGHLP